MGSRPNLLPPFPSFLILCPICRGTGIKRLSIGRKGDGGEVLQEPHEEERGFMVGELTYGADRRVSLQASLSDE